MALRTITNQNPTLTLINQSHVRIACELSSADELLLTEMMFNGLFNEMTPSLVAAILSCFVCTEKSNEMPKLTDQLSGSKMIAAAFDFLDTSDL